MLNQIINVPSYSQNNVTLGAQSSSFNFINSLYLPSTSQADTVTVKQGIDIQPKEEKNSDKVRYSLNIVNFLKLFLHYS